jgi:hypothetical protein
MPAPAPSSRTRLLLEGPIASTLLRLAAPNVIVNIVLIAVTATVDAHSRGRGAVPAVEIMKIVPADALATQVSWSPLNGDGSN